MRTKHLLILALLGLVALASGCAAWNKAIVKSYNDGYQAANQECMTVQIKMAEEMESLKARLKKFNQIDKDGNLR